MENWTNLSLYLNKANENSLKFTSLSRELIEACLQNDKTLIKKTLKSGAYINTHDEHITPLIACIQNDNSDLGAYLLKAGASISYKPNINFEDAFWYALVNKKHTFLQLFVDSKCLLDWSLPKNEKDVPKTPLIYATITSDLRAVEILLSHYNIKVNERDGIGNTALHYAVAKQNQTQDDIQIISLLIAAGADDSIANLDGKSPNELALSPEANSALLSSKLDNELPVHEEPKIEEEPEGPSRTQKGKLKI